jgi:cellobiose epimerase
MNIKQAFLFWTALVMVLSTISGNSATAAPPNVLPDEASWYRKQLIDGEVKPRLQYGLAPNGFYRPYLARDWQPKREQQGTLISQTRAIYVMTAGYEVTGERVYYDAMIKAADFLLENYADKKVPGRWANLVGPDGKVLAAQFHAYGYTHVIFALAHAYRASKDKKYLDAAFATWLQLDLPRTLQGRNPEVKLYGLNVAMHAFEGLLALYKADHSNLVLDDLKLLGEYILGNFFDSQRGFFYEELDANLRPAPNGPIRLGHNVEIAFLFSRAVDVGFPKKYLDAGNRAIDYVVLHGINRVDGSVPHELAYDGTVKDPTLIWWTHTELLRALGHYVVHRDRQDLRPAFAKTWVYAKLHFIDPVYGGWYEKPDGTDRPKGHDWMAGYHVAMMLTEMLRLQGVTFKSGSEMLL